MSFKNSWIYRKWTKQIILITYYVNPSTMYFEENLHFAKMTDAQARNMGYLRGKKIKDELKYATFPIYVRWSPNVEPMTASVYDMDLKANIENRETSSTLYDHFKSNAVEKFLKGMTTKTSLPQIDQKKLLMLAAIVIGAIVGVYIILR